MSSYDLAFLGHVCFDEVIPFEGETKVTPGSAVMCGAAAAARTGRRVAAVIKLAPDDLATFRPPFDAAGADVHVIPAEQTTYMRVIHPVADVDVREMLQPRTAGVITIDEVPSLDVPHVHLAGVADTEFSVALIESLKSRGLGVSTDMQSFVRQVDPATKEIHFRDVPAKRRICELLDSVKLDVVEAKLLTGTDDLETAAREVESWGCGEVVITESRGVLARSGGRTYYEAFSNRGIVGRTGRGDTTFAAWLSRRIDHDPAASLKFAAALVSLKMESPGPFAGTLEDVLERMRTQHS